MSELTILGGGPAGLAVAFYAHRRGIPLVLFEKAGTLGGMCRTFTHGAHRYDCGAHRFHNRDPEVTADLVGLLGDELCEVHAPSKVWDHGRFVDFPPTSSDVLRSWGLCDAARIGAELLRARRQSGPIITFEDFAIRHFGRTLSQRILLNYSEKLWGLPANELAPEVATRRLEGLSLRSLLSSLLFPGRVAGHLDGSFLYPKSGYGRITEALAGTLPAESIVTGSEISRIEVRDHRVRRLHFKSGATCEARGRVASTIPLTALTAMLGEHLPETAHQAASLLRFRHIRLVAVFVARPRISSNASIYVPDRAFCISRLYEPKNRSETMAPGDATSLVVEVPCFTNDSIHRMTPDRLAMRVVDELCELGLVGRNEVVDWTHHLIPNAYPVYTLDYRNNVEIVLGAIRGIENLDVLGRGGRFHYSHLHDHLRLGKTYAAELISNVADAERMTGAAYH